MAFKSEEIKSCVGEEWAKLAKEGKSCFAPAKIQEEEMYFEMELINLEYPLEYVEAGLQKYVKNPKITVSYHFRKIMTPFIKITHEGTKQCEFTCIA